MFPSMFFVGGFDVSPIGRRTSLVILIYLRWSMKIIGMDRSSLKAISVYSFNLSSIVDRTGYLKLQHSRGFYYFLDVIHIVKNYT